MDDTRLVSMVAAAMDEFWAAKEEEMRASVEGQVRHIVRSELNREIESQIRAAVRRVVANRISVTIEVNDDQEGQDR